MNTGITTRLIFKALSEVGKYGVKEILIITRSWNESMRMMVQMVTILVSIGMNYKMDKRNFVLTVYGTRIKFVKKPESPSEEGKVFNGMRYDIVLEDT